MARPWNEETNDVFLRLERGGTEFLSDISRELTSIGDGLVFSPALYDTATRIWRRSGYEDVHRLEVMERSLSTPHPEPSSRIIEARDPDWAEMAAIDRTAFDGFWRMSIPGLQEAVASTRKAAVLRTGNGSRSAGYAIVGAQWGVSYLQRIAVDPDHSGKRIGSDLVRAALVWGRGVGAQIMVLNVRKENARAWRLYEREGFSPTGSALRIMRYATDSGC